MIELKRGGGDQIFIWFMVGMVAFTVLLLALSGLAIMAEGHPAGVVLIIFALPFIGLTYYVYQEAAARSFTRITINNGVLELRLPAQRSYVPQEKVETTLQLSLIKAIEARTESFRALGTTALQFAYALVLADGGRIVLGADRRFTSPFYQEAAGVISNQLQMPIRNLGLVDGNPGIALLTGQKLPAWDAAPVAPATLQKRFKDEAAAWRVVSIIAGASLAIGALARAFG